jgi:pimeloyl-ACP methyl ester carboxylesterase
MGRCADAAAWNSCMPEKIVTPPSASRSLLARDRLHAASRGHLWTALGVALAAVGCAPPGPRTPDRALRGLRLRIDVGAAPDLRVSYLRAGPADGARLILVHGTQDDLVPVANVPFMQARRTGARCERTVLLEGRNHFLPWNSEAEVRDAIRMAQEPPC